MGAIRSRDNPRVKRWSRLVRDGRFRRKEGRTLIEGAHLVAAYLQLGKPIAMLATEQGLANGEIKALFKHAPPIILAEGIFRSLVDVETPQGVAAEIAIPEPQESEGDRVYLEGVQDPGNVGAIIRSAAAFGVGTVFLDRACADPWSPKVLRAGMGAHFSLAIHEAAIPSGKLVCAVPRGGTPLADADLSGPLCWVFGSEGKGVSPETQRKATVRVTIRTDPRTESLNVAAAAAICLHEAYRRRE